MLERLANNPSSGRWLWAIALTSLTLNILTLGGLLVVRGLLSNVLPLANQHLYESLVSLENYEDYQMDVHLIEDISLANADEVLFDDILEVPVQLTVDISETIPFKDVIPVVVDETITVNETIQAPLDIAGTRVFIPVPVTIDVPVNLTIEAPVDTLVPVQMSVPLDETLMVPVRELIPLRGGSGEPLSIALDLETTIPVPMDELLEDVNMLPMLNELHNALNIIETLLLLPTPDQQ